ncbi:MAG: polyketide cyclase [Rhodospirillales bacterium]|nr:polyketide cyclase [Rhodospirillales bacterium]
MLEIVATIIVVLLLLIAAIVAFAATRPSTFRIERATRIAAAPEKIYPLVENFHRWVAWSPYEKLDPDLKRTYGGRASGKGAVYAWEGNGKAGAGRMEIIDTAAPAKVTITLDFSRPFVAHNIAEFTMMPEGASTVTTWSMHGPQPLMAKVMTLFFNMDKMVGKDFESGLATLKTAAER